MGPETSSELTLPAFDARALARRAALPGAVAVAVAAVVVLAGGPLEAFADALRRALDADPAWVLAAVGFEAISFSGYIALMWLVGARATPRLSLRASAQISLGGAAVTRLLPTGGAGGVALTLWAFRRTGLEPREATRTLLSFLVLLYTVFLIAIVVAGGALALGLADSHDHLAWSAIPALGAALAIGLALAAATLRPRPDAGRLAGGAAALGGGVRDALAHLRSGDLRLLGAPLWWAFDAAVLWGMLNAFGAPPALAVVVLGYFVGMVANTIPLPGAVSGGMIGVLLAFGVEADLALASVLAYRALAIWLPAPIGLVALNGLRRTVARWGEEDAPADVAPDAPAIRRPAPAWRPEPAMAPA